MCSLTTLMNHNLLVEHIMELHKPKLVRMLCTLFAGIQKKLQQNIQVAKSAVYGRHYCKSDHVNSSASVQM